MNILCTMVLFLYGTNLFAAQHPILTLDMEVQIEGEPISHPKISTISGNTSSIETISESGDGFDTGSVTHLAKYQSSSDDFHRDKDQ